MVTLLVLLSGVAAAALPPPVAQALAAAGIPESAAGLYVQDVSTDKPILSHNPGRALNPASTMKLVTTYAGLELLGPAYTWNTDVYAVGAVSNEIVGDVVIKGYGDPKLTIENFWLMLRALRARGLREIRGDLVLDRSFFRVDEYDPAAFDGEPLRPYNVGPDALLVNFKAIALTLIPEPETRSVRIVAEPAVREIQIVNALAYNDAACGDWLGRVKIEAQVLAESSARLTLTGPYSRDCGERTRSFSLLGHRAYVGALFAQLWRELGGTFNGTVRDGPAPPGARLVTSTRSEALSEVVRDINKYSNNVMARQLFLTLGALGEGAPGTLDKARNVTRQWIAQKGIAASELVVDNGSGLSRIERVSARTLAELLVAAYRSPVMPELMASLPVVAADGTMRRRLNNADVAGQAHIKTGSLAGVRAIGGYVLDVRGHRVAVAFIVNHANAAGAREAQDALLRWVYRGGR